VKLILRPPLAGVVLAVLAVAAIAPAGAAAASWQLATSGARNEVPLGQVSAISFWAPNRGLLITDGTGRDGCAETNTTVAVPCGLYAYNGENWHLLSNQCGATASEGRRGEIAWAGPEEFWTISDQRPNGQQAAGRSEGLEDISLCHFLDGKIVASYALPLTAADHYQAMDAAACLSPTNCWFGGQLAEERSTNTGAFHLHWDGENLTEVYSPEDHAVSSMALAGEGTLFESVVIDPSLPGDHYGAENAAHPFVLHQIDPPGSSTDFHDLFMADGSCELEPVCPPLPDYESAKPEGFAGLSLGGDYVAPAAANPPVPQLWAVAGQQAAGGANSVRPIVLRYSAGEWWQMPAIGEQLEAQLKGQSALCTADPSACSALSGKVQGVAAEPGIPAAWLALGSNDEEAHIDRLEADPGEGRGRDGKGRIAVEEVPLGEAQKLGPRGSAGPIACPAVNDCWLATSRGWLFHLTDDSANTERTDGYPEDTDPDFAGGITYRPEDGASLQVTPIEAPPEPSVAVESKLPASTAVQKPTTRTTKALVTDVSSHIVHRYTLELSFRLTVKAHVQLLASRRSRRVAQTARETLKAGRHMLMLRLNPRSWPNKLDLKATPLEPLPTVELKGVTGHTVAPPVGSNNVET
jgi:hypothetical protein